MSSGTGGHAVSSGTGGVERVRVEVSAAREAKALEAREKLSELEEQTAIGEVLLRSLLRAQLRLALQILALFASLLGGLPLVFVAFGSLDNLRLAGVPLPWLALGVLVYPILYLLARLYVRLAEQTENDFADLVEEQ